MIEKNEGIVLGNGLRNMKANMQTIGGNMVWMNEPGSGTGITITYHLKTLS